MLLPLVVLFIVVPIAELYVIIQVGQQIGALPTIGILIADSIIGSMLLRSQGRAVWRRFNEAVGAGRPPAREVLDGALVIFGGAFLLTPGFITDVIGVFLLLPPTRALVRAVIVRRLGGRVVAGVTGAAGRRASARGTGAMGVSDPTGTGDVEGTAVEVDPPSLRG